MDSWAKAWDCHFICICVLGSADALPLALEMGKQMKLTKCVNGFIDDKAGMPRRGQLGCQGFILLDKNLKQVSASTSAFMRVRDLAFKHVEALLTATTKDMPLPAICPGEFCLEVGGSSEPAICIGTNDDQVIVAFLKSGKRVALPANKVRKVKEDDMEESGSESDEQDSVEQPGGCGTGGCQPGGCATAISDSGAQAQSGGYASANGASGQQSGGYGSANGTSGGCGTGGCGPGGCKVPVASSESPVPLLKGVPSVKVASMDAEHEECVKALNALVEQKSQDSLRSVQLLFKAHFKHEEELLHKSGWGGDVSDPFSAKGSHIKDHNRILEKIDNELKANRATLSASFIKSVMQDFEEHADRYDGHYADHLSALGVQ